MSGLLRRWRRSVARALPRSSIASSGSGGGLLDDSQLSAGCAVVSCHRRRARKPTFSTTWAPSSQRGQTSSTELFVVGGMRADAAHRMATMTIAATEGAMVLSRAQQEQGPFRRGGEHTDGLGSGASDGSRVPTSPGPPRRAGHHRRSAPRGERGNRRSHRDRRQCGGGEDQARRCFHAAGTRPGISCRSWRARAVQGGS